MSQLSKDVALRIALAARALPDIEVRDLLLGIIHELGEPLSTAKLNKIRLARLKRIQVLEAVDEVYLKDALGMLKGRSIEREPDPIPEVLPYKEGDMPGSIRVACASNSGSNIDAHFGSSSRFLIFQLSPDELRLVDIRTPGAVDPDDDKNVVRAKLINDCQVLYTISIGGPAAAKVVRSGLHPIKLPHGGDAVTVLQRLRETISHNPPPWLAKVMGMNPEERIRYKDNESSIGGDGRILEEGEGV